jgi:hypothetical protein
VDALSGIGTGPADQTLSADGVTSSISGSATDQAGNHASVSFGSIQIDKTPANDHVLGQRRHVHRRSAGADHLHGDRRDLGRSFEHLPEHQRARLQLRPALAHLLGNGHR